MQLIAAQLNGTHIGKRVTIHPTPVLSITGKVRHVIHVEDNGDGGVVGATYVQIVGTLPDHDRAFPEPAPFGAAHRLDPIAPVFIHELTPESRTA